MSDRLLIAAATEYLCRILSRRRKITCRPRSGTPRDLTSQTRRYGCTDDGDHTLISYRQFYDPRVWVREGEKTLAERVKEACADLGNVGELTSVHRVIGVI